MSEDHVETLEEFVERRRCAHLSYDETEQELFDALKKNEQLKTLRLRILEMMVKRGWSTHWIHRSAYLHLEAAELAEAVRGKRGDPLAESGDVLITLLALSGHGLPEIIAAAEDKLRSLETCPPYKGRGAQRLRPPFAR